MKSQEYSTSQIIDIDIETLFNIVSDFNNYSCWNTVIPVAEGELKEGIKLKLRMKMLGKVRQFNPKIKLVEMNKRFILSKVLFLKILGELTHQFEFKQLNNNQTELIQTWRGNGLLIKMMWSKIKSGFDEFAIFNDDLMRFIDKLKNTNTLQA